VSNFVFPQFRLALAQQLVDLEAEDWRALLVMTDATVTADVDAEFLGDIADLDEFDGAGYAREVMSGVALSVDAPTNQVRIDAADLDFGALGPGTRSIKGVLLFTWGGTDATSRPAVWIDTTKIPGPYFPYAAVGAVVGIKFDALGLAAL
jgi:hypothetical protein